VLDNVTSIQCTAKFGDKQCELWRLTDPTPLYPHAEISSALFHHAVSAGFLTRPSLYRFQALGKPSPLILCFENPRGLYPSAPTRCDGQLQAQAIMSDQANFGRNFLGEALGTFVLVLFGCGAVPSPFCSRPITA